MEILFGVAVVVAIVVAIVVTMAKRSAAAEAQRAEALEPERRRKEEEARKWGEAEYARLQQKRALFDPISAEIKAQDHLLVRKLTAQMGLHGDTYHYDHHDRLMDPKESERVALYQRWIDDSDFRAGKLTYNASDKRTIEEVVNEKKRLIGEAHNLHQSDIESYTSKKERLFAEAQSFGRTVEEHKLTLELEAEARAKMRKTFEGIICECVNARYSDGKDLETHRKNWSALAGTPEQDPAAFIKATLLLLGSVARQDVVSSLTGASSPVEQVHVEAARLLKQHPGAMSVDRLADFCATAELMTHRAAIESVESALNQFTGGKPDKYQIEYPFDEWADALRASLPEPRSIDYFRVMISRAA